MRSGSGKSVIFKWMEAVIETLRDKIAKLKYYEHMQRNKINKQTNKENDCYNIPRPSSSDIPATPSSEADSSVDVTPEELRRCMADWDDLTEEKAREVCQELLVNATDGAAKSGKFIPPQLIYEKITLAALVEHLGCNLEGRFSAIQLVDEATSIYKNAFDPDQMGKGQNDYYLDKSFLIKLFDGGRISNETKDAMRNKSATHVRRNGLTAFMGIQPENWLESLMFKDNEGVAARVLCFLGERVSYDASNDDFDENDEHVRSFMDRLNQDEYVPESECHKPVTYQLDDTILEQETVEYEIADVLYAIYKQHPTDKIKQYTVEGDANMIGAILQNAERKVSQHDSGKSNLEGWQLRWLGKATAKVLRLVWPIHALVHIYTTCRTKEDLKNMKLPTTISAIAVGKIVANLYVNATRTYSVPFEYLQSKESRAQMHMLIIQKIIKSPKMEIVTSKIATGWRHNYKYFKRTDIDEALAWVVKHGFATYMEEISPGSAAKIIGIRKLVDTSRIDLLTTDQLMLMDTVGLHTLAPSD